jgi:hypothetical protein
MDVLILELDMCHLRVGVLHMTYLGQLLEYFTCGIG